MNAARFASQCPMCLGAIEVGDPIDFTAHGWVCDACVRSTIEAETRWTQMMVEQHRQARKRHARRRAER